MKLCNVDKQSLNSAELFIAMLARKVLGLLMSDKDLLINEFSITIIAERFSGFLFILVFPLIFSV